jgi:hypothetical protein
MGNGTGYYKRINFFRGFLTTEEDWNDAERYHVEKNRLHRRMFHAPGVVSHFGGGLRVTARKRDELAVEIASGYAIDARGNDIWVPEPVYKILNPKDFKLPQTIFLTIQYAEELADFVAYKENPEFRGHRRVEEKYRVQFTNVEPDPEREIELARIEVSENVRNINDARDPMAPGANELDLRFVPFAGVVGPFVDPPTLLRIGRMIRLGQATYTFLHHDLGIKRAADVLHVFHTLELFLLIRQLDRRNLIQVNEMVLRLQQELIKDLDAHHAEQASSREFLTFKNQIRFLDQLRLEKKPEVEMVDHIIGYQVKACEALQGLMAYRVEPEAQSEALDPEKLWEAVKSRSAPFEKELILEGNRFNLVDYINVLDHGSEQGHEFEVAEYRDMFRSRQKFRYPDTLEGTLVEDDGVAFQGGYVQFKIRNAKAMRPLILVARIDYTYGDWKADVLVNNRRVREWSVVGRDRKYRWRNWPILLPADAVDQDDVHVRLVFKDAKRDINVFHVWAYQPA